MLDPAVLGTLLIGLGAERAEAERADRRHLATARRRHHRGVRVGLARGLRQAAALLDRPVVGEATN